MNASENDSRHISIKKEDGRGLADIGINRQIGIELKLDLARKADANRLVGQIAEFADDYPIGLIILLLGDTEHNAYQTVRDGMDKLRSRDQIFKILKKNLDESDHQQKPDNPFDGSPFGKSNDPFGANDYFKRINDQAREMNDRFSKSPFRW